MIECLTTCQRPDNPPRFPPISDEAYLTWWHDANDNASLQDEAGGAPDVRGTGPEQSP